MKGTPKRPANNPNLSYSAGKIDSIMSLAKQNKFTTVEEALDLLEKDPETNLYNHYFVLIFFNQLILNVEFVEIVFMSI